MDQFSLPCMHNKRRRSQSHRRWLYKQSMPLMAGWVTRKIGIPEPGKAGRSKWILGQGCTAGKARFSSLLVPNRAWLISIDAGQLRCALYFRLLLLFKPATRLFVVAKAATPVKYGSDDEWLKSTGISPSPLYDDFFLTALCPHSRTLWRYCTCTVRVRVLKICKWNLAVRSYDNSYCSAIKL